MPTHTAYVATAVGQADHSNAWTNANNVVGATDASSATVAVSPVQDTSDTLRLTFAPIPIPTNEQFLGVTFTLVSAGNPGDLQSHVVRLTSVTKTPVTIGSVVLSPVEDSQTIGVVGAAFGYTGVHVEAGLQADMNALNFDDTDNLVAASVDSVRLNVHTAIISGHNVRRRWVRRMFYRFGGSRRLY